MKWDSPFCTLKVCLSAIVAAEGHVVLCAALLLVLRILRVLHILCVLSVVLCVLHILCVLGVILCVILHV